MAPMMPEVMGLMHGRFATTVAGVCVVTGGSVIIWPIGVYSTVVQTGIGIASNLGTFILYGLICIWTVIAFAGRPQRNGLLHLIVPTLGLIMNLVMVITIFYLAFLAGGDSSKEGWIAIGFAAVGAVVSAIYVVINNGRTGRRLIPAEA